MISRDTGIEELIRLFPGSIQLLAEKGIRCIRCGEPVWGSLGSAATEKNFTEKQIEELVDFINKKFKESL